jgi:sugar lactone lactonase YvrE
MKSITSIASGLIMMICSLLLAENSKTIYLNPYQGKQERKEVFEFTQEPSIRREGSKWVISFAVKDYCDATVAIVSADGKVIRHLASGVLGKNAPYPFKQNSLSQTIEWDGKDDNGKPVTAECRVKVSLGLTAEFDKIERQHLFSGIRGMGVDKEGQLYVAMANGVLSESVHVFDRQGKLIRTIWPVPAHVPPEKNSIYKWNRTTKGENIPFRNRCGGGWGYSIFPDGDFFVDMNNLTSSVVALPDSRILFLSAGGEGGSVNLLFLDSKNGSCPAGSFVKLGNVKKGGIPTMGISISPDGKWIYFAGKVPAHASPGVSHAIHRAPVENPALLTVFVGEISNPGTDNAHFNGPTSIACDKDGNVYVADTGNKRIQVYKPDGTYIRTIPDAPYNAIVVSHKTGAIYGLWRSDKGWPKPMVITKLGGLNNPAKIAEITLGCPKGAEDFRKALIAIDQSSELPAIWFAGSYSKHPETLVKIEDTGTTLVQTVDARSANGLSNETGEADSGLDSHQYYITGDKYSDQIAYADAVGPDGLWYSRAMSMGSVAHWIVRRDPKKDIYVPFEVDGKPVSIWWSARDKWIHKGQPVIGIELYHHGGGPHAFQSPFDVAPNGDIYAMTTTGKKHLEDMTKMAIFNTGKPNAFHHIVLVYASDGKLKSPAALTGLWDCDGIRVGRSGAVYLVPGAKPINQKLPDGLAEGSTFHDTRWSSLVKFNSTFDNYPIGRMIGMWEDKDADGATHRIGGRKVKFENLLWSYDGVSPVSAGPGSCTCLKSSFDLDFYERAFVPAAQTYTVNVIDANGNVIARIGGYGNISDLATGKPPLFDIPRSVAVTDNFMWVHDCQHRAVIRSRLLYTVEKILPVR